MRKAPTPTLASPEDLATVSPGTVRPEAITDWVPDSIPGEDDSLLGRLGYPYK